MSLFQPCEKTKRSLTVPWARKSSKAAASAWSWIAPSLVNCTSNPGNPAISSMVRALDGLNGTHEINQSLPLKRPIAFQIRCRGEKNLLHRFRPANELATHRKKGGNDAGHVGRGHAGAAVFLVAGDDRLDLAARIRRGSGRDRAVSGL